jgi:hypothetical protein
MTAAGFAWVCSLPPVQEKLLRAVVSQCSLQILFQRVNLLTVCSCGCAQMTVQPRTVVVLMNGGAVAMPEDMNIPALVEAFCRSLGNRF